MHGWESLWDDERGPVKKNPIRIGAGQTGKKCLPGAVVRLGNGVPH